MSYWDAPGPSEASGHPSVGDPAAPPPFGPPAAGPTPYGAPQYPPPQYPPPQPPNYGPPGYAPPGVGAPGGGAPGYGPAMPYRPMPPTAGGYGLAPVPGGRLAGMGERFGGLLIDMLILTAIVAVLGIPLGAYHRYVQCDSTFTSCTTGVHVGSVALDVVAIVLGIAYSAYFVGIKGQTIGHRAVGIRVVDVDTGRPIGPARGALRWFVLGITGALCTLGYWSPFFDSRRRQGWHDRASASVVIPSAR